MLHLLSAYAFIASARALRAAAADLLLVGGRVMDPETGLDAIRNVVVRGDRIVDITEDVPDADVTLDVSDLVVAPGFIDTDMARELTDAQRELMLGQIPLGRLGQPEEIAALVGFLCGDAAGYITGETMHINGGMYMA